jgi:acetoin utilization protein AcuC
MTCKVGVVIGENLKYGFPEPHPLNYRRYEYFTNLLFESNYYKQGKIIKLESRRASDEEILLFHTREYLEYVKRVSEIGYGYLDYGDTPAFKGVYEVSALSVGATLRALEAVINGEVDHAFNPSGGLHHAYRYKAAGFCVFNDPAIAIEYSRKKYGFKKFLYVDIDAHHGDGVYYSYEDDPTVYIIDIHEDGRFLYPGTGFESEKGKGEAYGTKINIPLKPFSDTNSVLQYIPKIKEFIESIEFDLIVLQCGADGLEGDPLTHLRYSPKVHEEITKLLHKFAHEKCKGRIIATGGGGYNFNNVAKAWVTVVETLTKEY